MAGRKRKAGRRLTNGRLANAPRKERRDAITGMATAQPHRAWLPEAMRRDHHAECALGRLFLAGLISEPQCWAGERFRTLFREFRVVLASPVTVSAAGIMVAEGMETPMEADHLAAERVETDEERRERVLGQFDAMKRALRAVPDPRATAAQLEMLVVMDVCPDDLAPVRAGLDALAALWRLAPAGEGRAPVRRHRPFRDGDRASWPHEETEVNIVYGG